MPYIDILLHGIFHIIPFISPRSYQPKSRWAQGMIYEQGLIKGMISCTSTDEITDLYQNA